MRRSPGAILSSSALAAALALTGCGAGAATDPSGTATAAASAGSGAATESGTGSAGTGTTTAETILFGDGASPEVSIEWDEAAYADMIAAYEADGSKEWIQADITIDGTLVSDIGVRLKGNSTLRSLSGDSNGNGAMGGRGGNELKERFLASEAFQSLYDNAYADLYEQLFASGTAAGLLDKIAAVVPPSDDLTQEELAEQTDTLRTFIQERTEALKDQV